MSAKMGLEMKAKGLACNLQTCRRRRQVHIDESQLALDVDLGSEKGMTVQHVGKKGVVSRRCLE